MCRHLAYLGAPVSLASVLCDPPFGLLRQSWAPRRQRYGTVNADGFGVGWYADGHVGPARYRRAEPMWTDESFGDVARVTTTSALLAAVRSATEGTTQDPSAAAPYRRGDLLFSHNGRIEGWPESVAALTRRLPPAALLELESRCDSALLWALTLEALRTGTAPAAALSATVTAVAGCASGRFNLLLTDGHSIVATAYGDTLFYRFHRSERAQPGRVVLASEPDDDSAEWVEVPDRSLVVATRRGVTVEPLPTAVTPVPPRRPLPAGPLPTGTENS
jgi:gamma-glutamyl hercynylcysteine S-oxide hydrolase